jgi:hypothetical protein
VSDFAAPALVSQGLMARIRTFAFAGIEAVPVEVQVQISAGVPSMIVVGLPDKAVGEARERVRAALTAMGLALPSKRVLINLAAISTCRSPSRCWRRWTCCRATRSTNTPRWANCRWTAR